MKTGGCAIEKTNCKNQPMKVFPLLVCYPIFLPFSKKGLHQNDPIARLSSPLELDVKEVAIIHYVFLMINNNQDDHDVAM